MKDELQVKNAQALLADGPQPGEFFRHWKGSVCVVTERSVDEEDLIPLVSYRYLDTGNRWTRTIDKFTGLTGDGVRRFVRVGENRTSP